MSSANGVVAFAATMGVRSVLARRQQQLSAAVAGLDHDEPFRPLAHQVAPAGDWDTWLLLGGRGSGKTAAAARYTHEHVNGPACLPNLPGGHRIAIIAPTFGDAVEACVNGPSGLRAHDPAVRVVQTFGGTFVRWPNGAEAKLFGAYTPEDVERLRAGGNRSLRVGTLIATADGDVPIEQVRVGDLVWTRRGLRPVLASWGDGRRPIWTIETASGRVLHVSPDHQVWVAGRGWIRCDGLAVGDRLSSWNGVVTAGNGWGEATGHGPIRPSSPLAAWYCIAPSLRPPMAGFPMGGRSTIGTPMTRTQPTRHDWSSSTPGSTGTGTAAILTGMRPEAWLASLFRHDGPGVSVAQSSSRHGPALASALGRAGASSNGFTRYARSSVSCVASTSIAERSPTPSLAPDPVVTVVPGSIERDVWDLSVAGAPEFIANGILAHNCYAYAEELAAWRFLDQCFDHLQLGLRLGDHPKLVAATTPKPRGLLKRLIADTRTAVTHATTFDNPHLSDRVRLRYVERYGGTALGRQELQGLLIEEPEGALWVMTMFDDRHAAPDLARVVVAVDPSGGSDASADEQGIVVCGLGVDGRGYVLADRSCKLSPAGWGARAVAAYQQYAADSILVERNYGGDMAEAVVLGAARAAGEVVKVKMVTASRGKRLRAEPVVALYEQGKVTHCEVFEELEAQMCAWTPESGTSPDRLDALVWALTELMVKEPPPERQVYVY